MTEASQLDERLRAVERALTETDRDLTGIADASETTDRLEDLEDRLEAVETQVTELEAAVQAIRGYVGSVRAVNRDVEERADAALATARAVERRLDGSPDPEGPGGSRRSTKFGGDKDSSGEPDESGVGEGLAGPTAAGDSARGPGAGNADGGDGAEEPAPDPDRVPDPWSDTPWQTKNGGSNLPEARDSGHAGEGKTDGEPPDEWMPQGSTTACRNGPSDRESTREISTDSVPTGGRNPGTGASDRGIQGPGSTQQSPEPEPDGGSVDTTDSDGENHPTAGWENHSAAGRDVDDSGTPDAGYAGSDPTRVQGQVGDGPGTDGEFEGWWAPETEVDVERTEPWSVPDRIADTSSGDQQEEEGLLTRFRRAL